MRSLTWSVCALALFVTASGSSAQRGMSAAPVGPPPACPASGYSPAYYSTFGQNGGDGNTAYEIASPCIGQEVRDAAVAIGMGRDKLLGVKNVITIMFTAEGTFNGDTLRRGDFHIAYYLPAMRM